MDLKTIRKIPFGDFSEKSKVRWKVIVRQPVINGERLLAVDFLDNKGCVSYRREASSFRVVCSKKAKEVRGMTAGAGDKPARVTNGALESLSQYQMGTFLFRSGTKRRWSVFLEKAGRTQTTTR